MASSLGRLEEEVAPAADDGDGTPLDRHLDHATAMVQCRGLNQLTAGVSLLDNAEGDPTMLKEFVGEFDDEGHRRRPRGRRHHRRRPSFDRDPVAGRDVIMRSSARSPLFYDSLTISPRFSSKSRRAYLADAKSKGLPCAWGGAISSRGRSPSGSIASCCFLVIRGHDI